MKLPARALEPGDTITLRIQAVPPLHACALCGASGVGVTLVIGRVVSSGRVAWLPDKDRLCWTCIRALERGGCS